MDIYAPPAEIAAPDLIEYFGKDGKGIEQYSKDEQAYVERLAEYVREHSTGSKLAGEVVSVPYADGAAQYMVVKFGGKHALMHLPLGDAWRDARFERTVTVKELTQTIEDKRKLDAIFGR